MEAVAVPVANAALIVRSSLNATVPATILSADPARSHQIAQNRESPSVPPFMLHFSAAVPAFGYAFYTAISADLHEEAGAAISAAAKAVPAPSSDDALDGDFIVVGNDYLSLSFSRQTNLLSSVTDIKRNTTISCSQTLLYYEAEGHLLIDFKHKKCVAFRRF